MTTNLRKIEPEADGILKDGQTIRVSMTIMDAAVQQELADKFSPFVADHHRPNSAILTDEQKKAAHERQVASDKRLSEAWRNPAHLIVAQDLSVTPPEVLKPIAFGSGESVAALDALQADNQAKYNARIENAWRNPINHGARGC